MHTAQANHAEEVLDMVLPAGHQPTKVMQPSKKSFDSPTSAIAAQRTTILRWLPALSAMRCDHHDAVALDQVTVQTVTVIGFVADQSRRESVEETVPEDSFDEWLSCDEALSILRREEDCDYRRKRGFASLCPAWWARPVLYPE